MRMLRSVNGMSGKLVPLKRLPVSPNLIPRLKAGQRKMSGLVRIVP
jgi:hypothetical protein